jgi:glycosyltransferase involved in cell wall biosynthesis
MRAIHVNTSASWGGLEQYTLFMMDLFRTAGVDVALMGVPGTPIMDGARERGFDVIPARRGKHVNLPNILRLRRALHQRPDTIVHSHTRIDVWTASLACMGTNIPHVHSVHMIPVNKRDPLHGIIYGRVDATVNTCETHVRSIAERFPVRPGTVHLIRHMRDPRTFTFNAAARADYRAEWGVADDELVVGFLGRIDPLKGVREFAESIDHLPDALRTRVRLVVVGEPSIAGRAPDGTPQFEPGSARMFTWVRERAADPQHRLLVRPFTADVAGVMSAFDMFVLATYGEMYALTVIEAMMVGLPVIGTNADGTPDQLANGRGMLVEPRSASSIAAAITSLAADPEQRASMAGKGHAWAVHEFDPRTVVPAWIDLYHHVLHLRQPHGS